MKQIEKIPLANRLRQAAAKQPTPYFLHIYRFYMDTYFYGLAELAGDNRDLTEILDKNLLSRLAQYEEPPLLADFVAESMELPRWELGELLYQVLVKPFAELEERRKSI